MEVPSLDAPTDMTKYFLFRSEVDLPLDDDGADININTRRKLGAHTHHLLIDQSMFESQSQQVFESTWAREGSQQGFRQATTGSKARTLQGFLEEHASNQSAAKKKKPLTPNKKALCGAAAEEMEVVDADDAAKPLATNMHIDLTDDIIKSSRRETPPRRLRSSLNLGEDSGPVVVPGEESDDPGSESDFDSGPWPQTCSKRFHVMWLGCVCVD